MVSADCEAYSLIQSVKFQFDTSNCLIIFFLYFNKYFSIFVSGCHFNGQIVIEGHEVTLSEDPCLKCYCSNKRLTCTKKACPVLQCPKSKQIKPLLGECCPRCMEKRPVQDFRGKCIFGTGFHANGDRFNPDYCSNCQCNNGTSICRRDTCPVLECPLQFQKIKAGECCSHCPEIAEVRSTCAYDGKSYQVNFKQM